MLINRVIIIFTFLEDTFTIADSACDPVLDFRTENYRIVRITLQINRRRDSNKSSSSVSKLVIRLIKCINCKDGNNHNNKQYFRGILVRFVFSVLKSALFTQ